MNQNQITGGVWIEENIVTLKLYLCDNVKI